MEKSIINMRTSRLQAYPALRTQDLIITLPSLVHRFPFLQRIWPFLRHGRLSGVKSLLQFVNYIGLDFGGGVGMLLVPP